VTAGKYESYIRQSAFSPTRLLRDEFCSLSWIKASFALRRDRQGRKFYCRKRGAYPVPGMARCARCRVWAPTDGCDPLCATCRIETDQLRFVRRARRWPKEIRLELFRRYWRSSKSIKDWLYEGMPASISDLEYHLDLPQDGEDEESPIGEADVFGGSLESDQRWGNTPSFRDALTELRRRFCTEHEPEEGKKQWRLRRRGGGCRKPMLPESKAQLRKEIDYYLRKGKIKRYARRVSNPFDKFERPLVMPGRRGASLL
jgi:hypothetical protein